MSDEPERLNREEIAHREIGSTDIQPWLAWTIAVAFLVIIGLVPLWQLIHDLGHGEETVPAAVAGIPMEAIAGYNASQGSAWQRTLAANAKALETIDASDERLNRQSVLSALFLGPTQEFLTGRFGLGTEEVYPGRDGWLFFRANVDYLTGPGFLDPITLHRRSLAGSEFRRAPSPDPRPALLSFQQYLSARGISLVVMPVPLKAMIHPEQLSQRFAGQGAVLQNPSYDAFRAELEAAGIILVDPTATIAEASAPANGAQDMASYLRTDTHWTPQAMERTAILLARSIEELGVLPPVPDPGFTRTAATATHYGDLTMMLQLPEAQTLYPPETVSVQPVSTADGAPFRADPTADILLLGDSFTNMYTSKTAFARTVDGRQFDWGEAAGLAPQLAWHLRRRIDSLAHNAGGAHATREALRGMLARGEDRLAGKRVVVLQFAMRELASGDWRPVNWPEPTADAGEPPPPAATEAATVRATITDLARPPRPGTVPYADCLVGVHLTAVEVLSGGTVPAEILVMTWGMRDNRWTDAARLHSGRPIQVVLQPWDDQSPTYGTIQQVLLGTDADFLPLFWVETMTAGEP